MAEKTYCKLQYCINDCHVMSCHVAIVVSILKNTFQKLFHFTKLFINILQASLLVLIKLSHSPKASRRNEDLKNPRLKPAVWRVIHKKEILLFWIATLHFVSLAMTKKILSLRGFVKTEVIQNICCAFLITMWLQPIVLTIQREAHKGFAIGVPLGKPLVIRNWIASLAKGGL